jgi:hypothetical protein
MKGRIFVQLLHRTDSGVGLGKCMGCTAEPQRESQSAPTGGPLPLHTPIGTGLTSGHGKAFARALSQPRYQTEERPRACGGA